MNLLLINVTYGTLQCRHFLRARECFARESTLLKLEKRGENGASQKEWGLLSLIFLRHNKDGGYNSTNINKQLSPSQNTPALQASPSVVSSDPTHNWLHKLYDNIIIILFPKLMFYHKKTFQSNNY